MLQHCCSPDNPEGLDLPLKPVNLLLPIIRSFSEQDEKEDEVYYYHGDHLGSASWITDKTGTPFQYIHYAPYGELIANQRASGYDERFKFTGKERDTESGYNYHGARFLWGDAGFWLSVDPLADKYPGLSPYLYCNGNPIMLVDPDGRSFCDKVVGFGMGVFTNAIPCLSSLRDSYTPDDRDDYNAGLLTADLISGMTGAYLTAAGVADVGVGCSEIFGGGCVALSVVGAPEGALVAGGGCVLVLKGTGEVAAGNYLMSQASINIGQGYNRGQRKGDGTTDTSKFKNSRRLTDTELNQYFGSPNWHKNGSKTSLVKKFSKELKGDTNVDIYVDKKSKQIYLKGNKSGTWVDTGDVLDF